MYMFFFYISCIHAYTTCVYSHMFNDDPRDVIHTVPFVLTPVEDDIKKASQPPLSLWMSEHCSNSVVCNT